MMRLRFLFAALLALLTPAIAQADRLDWGATVEGRVGYGTNPFLDSSDAPGTGLVGVTIAPHVTLHDPTATTELSGSYNRDQYFAHYGDTSDYQVDLRRNQKFGSKLTGSAHVGYSSIVSGLFSPYYNTVVTNPTAVDQLAVGTRTQRVVGDAGLQWTPTGRDAFNINVIAEHDTYAHYGGDYSYIGSTVGYSRALNARTRVGVQLTAGHIYAEGYPNSSSLQPGVTLQQTLSAHWTFNGSVGAIIERERLAGRSTTHVSPGFNASLCHDGTRSQLCLTASRVSAPSGIGGLREQTQFGANFTYKLSPRSRIIGTGVYGISNSDDAVVINAVRYGNQRYALGRIDYQRDLSQRISAGVGGSYQARSGSGLPNVHALAITFNLTARFGHTT